MSYTIEIPYKVKLDYDTSKRIMLTPDEPISFQFGGSFNWRGNFYIEGESIALVIHQESIHSNPSPEDIIIDERIIINKNAIINAINETMNNNMR